MVRAILDGTKTQTRRVMKPQPTVVCERIELATDGTYYECTFGGERRHILSPRCPYGVPGDRLWVREGLRRSGSGVVVYAADGVPVMVDGESRRWEWQRPYLSGRFMPKWASRIARDLVGVRGERVQEITCADARAEGIRYAAGSYELEWLTPTAREARRIPDFSKLWDNINAKRKLLEGDMGSWPADYRPYTWANNPWVWVLEVGRMTE
jgi:hypothetical protein